MAIFGKQLQVPVARGPVSHLKYRDGGSRWKKTKKDREREREREQNWEKLLPWQHPELGRVLLDSPYEPPANGGDQMEQEGRRRAGLGLERSYIQG